MPEQTRLDSWKEIAAYLQRNAVTVRRWEKEEGLPIHRHSHKTRSSVYAYPSEIDAWRASRKAVVEPAPTLVNTLWRIPTFALAIVLCLIMAGNGIRPQVVSAKNGPLAKRLVCPDCGDSEANLSPDGRTMVFTDWESGDLAVRDLSTRKVKRLMAKMGGWAASSAYGEAPVLSPDRRLILYDWYPEKGGREQLRLVPNEPGRKARILVDRPEYSYYETEGWFPDGKAALVLISKPDSTGVLARVSVSDGAVTVLKPLGWRGRQMKGRARLSPDGRYIAYDVLAINPSTWPPAPADPKDRRIYVLSADGSTETEIVKTAGANVDPVWTEDGRHLLFTSDRLGQMGLWSVPVKDGKVAGAESLVSAGIGDVSAVGMAAGSYFYEVRSTGEYIHIATISSNGSEETESFVGISPTWSPDGKSVSFKRHHPGSADQYDLVIRSLATGEERTPLAGIGTSGGGFARWFPDGGSLFTGVTRNDGTRGFYRIDFGRTANLKEFPFGSNCGLDRLSPDEKTLFLRCSTGGHGPYRLVARDVSSGQEQVLASYANTAPLITALSRDGRTIAIGLTDRAPDGAKLHIYQVSVDGTGYREVVTSDRTNGFNEVAWDRDGRSILFDQVPVVGKPGVMRVPAEGGPATPMFISAHNYVRSFDLNADGSHIAYGTNDGVSELWALDNVLPALK